MLVPRGVRWGPLPVSGVRAVHAAVGDRLVVHSAHVGDKEREGEIVEVRHEDGSPPYLVRWAGTTHESLLYPGPDAEVRHVPHPSGS